MKEYSPIARIFYAGLILALAGLLVGGFVTACGSAGAGGGGGGNGGDDTVEDDDTPGEDDQPDDDGPAAGVRIQGSLSGVVEPSSSISGAALSSAALNVAAIPVVAGQVDVEATESADVGDDGSFAVDVEPEPDTEHVLLATEPGAGDGVEQARGFIELPAGSDESSTGWSLADAVASEVDLGTVSDAGDLLLPSTDQAELYEELSLNADDVRFEAQRDNLLKLTKNAVLNQDARMRIATNHQFVGRLETAENAWIDTQDIVEYDKWLFLISFYAGDDTVSYSDAVSGAETITITPPADVISDIGPDVYSPSNPLVSADNDSGIWAETGDDEIGGIAFFGPPPEGAWRLEIGGETDGVYNLGTSTPFDEDQNFIYYLPSMKLNVDEATSEIESYEFRFLYWDPDAGSYQTVTDEAEIPFDFGFKVSYEIGGSGGDQGLYEWESPGVIGEPQTTPEPVYLETVSGERVLNDLSAGYNLGVPFSFVWGLPPHSDANSKPDL